jgi:hypothetical protein
MLGQMNNPLYCRLKKGRDFTVKLCIVLELQLSVPFGSVNIPISLSSSKQWHINLPERSPREADSLALNQRNCLPFTEPENSLPYQSDPEAIPRMKELNPIHNVTTYSFKINFGNVLKLCRSSDEQSLASYQGGRGLISRHYMWIFWWTKWK